MQSSFADGDYIPSPPHSLVGPEQLSRIVPTVSVVGPAREQILVPRRLSEDNFSITDDLELGGRHS